MCSRIWTQSKKLSHKKWISNCNSSNSNNYTWTTVMVDKVLCIQVVARAIDKWKWVEVHQTSTFLIKETALKITITRYSYRINIHSNNSNSKWWWMSNPISLWLQMISTLVRNHLQPTIMVWLQLFNNQWFHKLSHHLESMLIINQINHRYNSSNSNRCHIILNKWTISRSHLQWEKILLITFSSNNSNRYNKMLRTHWSIIIWWELLLIVARDSLEVYSLFLREIKWCNSLILNQPKPLNHLLETNSDKTSTSTIKSLLLLILVCQVLN